jgi:hypothetical protein
MTTPAYTVSWTSALSGNRNSSACATKQAALREAKALYTEGARNISVTKFANGMATEVNWRIALRTR